MTKDPGAIQIRLLGRTRIQTRTQIQTQTQTRTLILIRERERVEARAEVLEGAKTRIPTRKESQRQKVQNQIPGRSQTRYS